jgi:uncharacterized protein
VPKPAAGAAHGVRDGLCLAAGLAVAAAAILLAPQMAGMLPIESPLVLNAAFYGLIFGPMAIAALAGGWLTGMLPSAGAQPLRWAPVSLVGGAAGLIAAACYAWLAGSAVPGSAGPGAGGALQMGAFLAGIVIIAGQVAAEELFFRGWMQPLLARHAGPVAALIVAAIAFAGFHMLGGSRAPLTLLNLLLGGVWFGLLGWRSGGLIAPVAAHFGWNAAEQLGMGLDPNPGIGDFGALLDWDLTGIALWGGTAEGLNASLAMTFVLAALLMPLIIQRQSTAKMGSPAAI